MPSPSTRSHTVASFAGDLDRPFLVVALCAAWCDTCTQFRREFDALVGRTDAAAFVWLDIEDDAEVVGDVDVENFPTIAIFHGQRVIHFGVSLPFGAVVARLLDALSPEHPDLPVDPAVRSLRTRLLEKSAASA